MNGVRRNYGIDSLKIYACMCVVGLHVFSNNVNMLSVNDFNGQNFFANTLLCCNSSDSTVFYGKWFFDTKSGIMILSILSKENFQIIPCGFPMGDIVVADSIS